MKFGGEDPLKKYFPLLGRAIGIHLNKASTGREPLDLSNRANRIRPLQVMNRVDR